VPDLLKVSDLVVDYVIGKGRKVAVDNAALEIASTGDSLGLVGESGSGKTTLGLSVMKVIEAPGRIASGRIEYMDRDVLSFSEKELRKYRWQEVSMVYQSAMNSLNPVKTVSSHIVEVIREHSNVSKSEARERAIKLLSQVGISDRVDDYPHEFSGGMRQRVIIAMALALSPKLLIADEPTSALDVVVQRQVLSLLKEQAALRGLSLLFITHEIAILCGLVKHVAVMYEGEIVERAEIDKTLFEPLHPYTEMLVSSLLTLETERGKLLESLRLSKNERRSPSMVGCKYSTRCKYAFARCRIERPILQEVENGRWVACHKYS